MEEDSSDMQRYTARYYQILVVLQPPTNCSGQREVLARILPDLAEKMGEIVVRSPVEIRWLADENSREESTRVQCRSIPSKVSDLPDHGPPGPRSLLGSQHARASSTASSHTILAIRTRKKHGATIPANLVLHLTAVCCDLRSLSPSMHRGTATLPRMRLMRFTHHLPLSDISPSPRQPTSVLLNCDSHLS